MDSGRRKPDPRLTVIAPRPDMVSQRIRRYEAKPELWQVTNGQLISQSKISRSQTEAPRSLPHLSSIKDLGHIHLPRVGIEIVT